MTINENVSVTFRRNPDSYQVLLANESQSLLNSNFDFNNKVKVLTHGWLNHGFSPMPESIKEGKQNIIFFS